MSFDRNTHKLQILLVLLAVTGCNVARDQTDAGAVASRVHSQMRAGDFATIYRESAPRFKSVGSESQFVSMMQQMTEENGVLKKADEVAYSTGVDSRIGRTHMISFSVEYEHGHLGERMTLTRSDSGQMQLWKLEWFR